MVSSPKMLGSSGGAALAASPAGFCGRGAWECEGLPGAPGLSVGAACAAEPAAHSCTLRNPLPEALVQPWVGHVESPALAL